MYIEFDLREIYYPTLEQELHRWWDQHQIEFHLKIINRIAKLTFTDPEFYTFFCLTWDPTTINAQKYRLIEPMKIDKRD